MCGIIGSAHAELGVDPATLPLDLLTHRGPDGEGRLGAGRIAIAMRRLAIIDLDTGDQPIANEDGSVACVCNGVCWS